MKCTFLRIRASITFEYVQCKCRCVISYHLFSDYICWVNNLDRLLFNNQKFLNIWTWHPLWNWYVQCNKLPPRATFQSVNWIFYTKLDTALKVVTNHSFPILLTCYKSEKKNYSLPESNAGEKATPCDRFLRRRRKTTFICVKPGILDQRDTCEHTPGNGKGT